MSQNVDFGPKRGKFGPKRPKLGGTRFFPELSLGYFINRPKMQFKYSKLRRSYDSFPRNLPKCPFLGYIGPKTGQTGFFGPNPKMSLPSH